MKSKEEIEQLANNNWTLGDDYTDGYIKGYTQCQEDNDWTKNCECESSIGQTWCCNQCGLPYDTRKSDKKYTEEDMRECWRACLNFNKPAGLDSGINYQDFINSLNKQD
jgi:hypothetical protein